MLLDKARKILTTIVCSLLLATAFAATTDLSTKFLDRANEAYEEGNIDDAYKYVNQALAVTKDESAQANILYFAQTVYTTKLQAIQSKYDEMALIDIQMNLERYPKIESTKIKKIIKQIETDQQNKQTAERQKVEQERFQAQQDSMDSQAQAMKELANATKENLDATKENQEKITNAISSIGSEFSKTAEETKRSTKVIAFAVIGIALIILIVIMLIVVICKKGFNAQQVQHDQYVQAFKMLAANQNQTNRIMLGGITDLYGSNPTLRLAGTSTWAPAAALPDVEFSEEDQEDLKQLAVKCEEIGTKIDQITGRKNNSKNISELVYKLSMQLGLPQGMAMLNFCAAMIYDAGFLGMDPELLTATSLTDEQKKAMKDHVHLAEKHLEFVPKKYWSVFEDAAMKHHENMDGTGYPQGLKGDEIPQIARLIRVAETYVSLSSKRNYRETMDKESAIQMLKDQPQFYDPMVVEMLDQIV